MPSSCIVSKCKNKGRSKLPDGVSLHNFPRHKLLRSEWISRLKTSNGPDFHPISSHRVCSQHFTPDCFRSPTIHRKTRANKELAKLLTPDSVPTIFPEEEPKNKIGTKHTSLKVYDKGLRLQPKFDKSICCLICGALLLRDSGLGHLCFWSKYFGGTFFLSPFPSSNSCPFCDLILNETIDQRIHIKTHIKTLFTFRCFECVVSFETIVGLTRHAKTRHNFDLAKPSGCVTFCKDKSLTDRASINNHCKYQHGFDLEGKTYPLDCLHCGESVPDIQKMLLHTHFKHPSRIFELAANEKRREALNTRFTSVRNLISDVKERQKVPPFRVCGCQVSWLPKSREGNCERCKKPEEIARKQRVKVIVPRVAKTVLAPLVRTPRATAVGEVSRPYVLSVKSRPITAKGTYSCNYCGYESSKFIVRCARCLIINKDCMRSDDSSRLIQECDRRLGLEMLETSGGDASSSMMEFESESSFDEVEEEIDFMQNAHHSRVGLGHKVSVKIEEGPPIDIDALCGPSNGEQLEMDLS